jgi:hypothetical protein
VIRRACADHENRVRLASLLRSDIETLVVVEQPLLGGVTQVGVDDEGLVPQR